MAHALRDFGGKGEGRAPSGPDTAHVAILGEPGGCRHTQGFRADLGRRCGEEAVHAGRPHGARR